MADEGDIRIETVDDARRIHRGSLLEGTVLVRASVLGTVELSVGWCTEGRGSTNTGTTFFRVVDAKGGERMGDWVRFALRAPMPLLPLSYYGTLIKIHWRIRARLLQTVGRDVTVDHPIEVIV